MDGAELTLACLRSPGAILATVKGGYRHNGRSQRGPVTYYFDCLSLMAGRNGRDVSFILRAEKVGPSSNFRAQGRVFYASRVMRHASTRPGKLIIIWVSLFLSWSLFFS
jgi:hypothetical protein